MGREPIQSKQANLSHSGIASPTNLVWRCPMSVVSVLRSVFGGRSASKHQSSTGQEGFDPSQCVTIGTQTWMSRNLDVSRFRNGEPIPEARTTEEWIEAGKNGRPVWCYYENKPELGVIYGRLYNWFAVADPRGLAPDR